MSDPYPDSSVQEGIAYLAAAHHELAQLLDELKAELSPCLDRWDANARTAYLNAQRQWDVSARRQQQLLQGLTEG